MHHHCETQQQFNMSLQEYSPASRMIPSNKTCFVTDSHGARAFQIFQDMRTKEELCDIFICSGGRRFPAHKVVLAGTCPLFREKIATAKEKGNKKKVKFVADDELEIPEQYDNVAVLNVLNFLYTGKLVWDVNQMVELIQLVYYLKIDEVMIACERFSADHLRPNNCIAFLKVSEALDLEQLKQKAMEYIEWNFLQVASEEDFDTLTATQITSLLGSNKLRAKSEEKVYEAVWKWYKHDPKQRDQHLDSLLKTVRFRQISTKFIRTRVIPELVDGAGRHRLLVEALNSRRPYELTSQDHKYYETARNSHKIVYLFSKKTNKVDKFDEKQRACVPCYELACSDAKDDDIYRVAAVVQEELYVVSNTEVRRFNPVTKKWSTVGKGRRVQEASVCSDKHSIYVIGGKANGHAAYRFDVSLGLWTALPEMIRPRRCTGVVILGHRIYVIGGINDDGLLTTMERFGLRHQTWKELPGLLEPRFNFGVTTQGRNILVFGGRSERQTLKTMELYHPQEDQWMSARAQLNDARSEFGHAVCENQIYCFGGRGIQSIERYDYLNEQWRIVGKIGENSFSTSCIVYPPVN